MYQKYFKRLLDIALSFVGIIILSPVFAIVAILVKKKLGSPIIFSQERPGKNEKIFKMYKFRSMTDERDEEGVLLSDNERLPKFGRTLRSTSLDELPELWNILKGDMSIVGPRPLLKEYLPYYTEKERKRHVLKPGLTGIAQVNGRNSGTWEQKFDYDLEYITKYSFFYDIKIVIKTIKKVIKRSDVLVGDEVTAGRLDDYRKNKSENFKHEKVSIRKFCFDDIPNKIEWVNDVENNRYLNYELPLEYKKTCEWYDRTQKSEDRFDGVIEYGGVPIGLIGLLNIDFERLNAEEYIMIGNNEFKNKGIAKKAGYLNLIYGFETLNLKEIYAFIHEDNVASLKLYEEKRKFTKEKISEEKTYLTKKNIEWKKMSMSRKNFM